MVGMLIKAADQLIRSGLVMLLTTTAKVELPGLIAKNSFSILIFKENVQT